MRHLLLLVMSILLAGLPVAQAEVPKEKKDEIEKMLKLTGMEKIMDQMIHQMIGSFKEQIKEVPPVFWEKFQKKMNPQELIELLLPLYDKFYTVEDLKAVNAFYESPAGRKMLSTMPQLMQESMKIGQDWGEKIGKQAVQEAQAELKKKE